MELESYSIKIGTKFKNLIFFIPSRNHHFISFFSLSRSLKNNIRQSCLFSHHQVANFCNIFNPNEPIFSIYVSTDTVNKLYLRVMVHLNAHKSNFLTSPNNRDYNIIYILVYLYVSPSIDFFDITRAALICRDRILNRPNLICEIGHALKQPLIGFSR